MVPFRELSIEPGRPGDDGSTAEDLHMPMPEHHTTVAGYLRQAGYFTGHM
jgi:hypothetical protein